MAVTSNKTSTTSSKTPTQTPAQKAASDYTRSRLAGVNRLIVDGKVIVDKTGGKNIDLRPSSGGGSTRNIITIDDKTGEQTGVITVPSKTPYGTTVKSPVFSPAQMEADRTSISVIPTIKPITSQGAIVGYEDTVAQQSVSKPITSSAIANLNKVRAIESSKVSGGGYYSSARLEAERTSRESPSLFEGGYEDVYNKQSVYAPSLSDYEISLRAKASAVDKSNQIKEGLYNLPPESLITRMNKKISKKVKPYFIKRDIVGAGLAAQATVTKNVPIYGKASKFSFDFYQGMRDYYLDKPVSAGLAFSAGIGIGAGSAILSATGVIGKTVVAGGGAILTAKYVGSKLGEVKYTDKGNGLGRLFGSTASELSNFGLGGKRGVKLSNKKYSLGSAEYIDYAITTKDNKKVVDIVGKGKVSTGYRTLSDILTGRRKYVESEINIKGRSIEKDGTTRELYKIGITPKQLTTTTRGKKVYVETLNTKPKKAQAASETTTIDDNIFYRKTMVKDNSIDILSIGKGTFNDDGSKLISALAQRKITKSYPSDLTEGFYKSKLESGSIQRAFKIKEISSPEGSWNTVFYRQIGSQLPKRKVNKIYNNVRVFKSVKPQKKGKIKQSAYMGSSGSSQVSKQIQKFKGIQGIDLIAGRSVRQITEPSITYVSKLSNPVTMQKLYSPNTKITYQSQMGVKPINVFKRDSKTRQINNIKIIQARTFDVKQVNKVIQQSSIKNTYISRVAQQPGQVTKQPLKVFQLQEQVIKQSPKLITRLMTRSPHSLTYIPKIIIPNTLYQKIDNLPIKGKKKKNTSYSNMYTEYNPTLRSIGLGIKAKKSGQLTGIDIRPMVG